MLVRENKKGSYIEHVSFTNILCIESVLNA